MKGLITLILVIILLTFIFKAILPILTFALIAVGAYYGWKLIKTHIL